MGTANANEKLTLTAATIVRETEKAIQAEVQFHLCDGEPRTSKVWFPKSRIEIDGEAINVEAWMLTAKEDEISSRFHGNQVTIEAISEDGLVRF
jgi:HSP20 family molecular chaperone IbpA